MNPTTLTRSYQYLSAWERVKLRLAAHSRKDEVEEQRLDGSAPTTPLPFKHHQLTEVAINTFTLIYITEQLDAASSYFYALFKLPKGDEEIDAAQDDDLRLLLMLHDFNAYLFHIRAKAWRRLWTEIGIDPDHLVASNYFGWMLKHFEENVIPFVPDQERILRRMAEQGQAPGKIVDAESEYRSMRDLLREMAWNVPLGKDVS